MQLSSGDRTYLDGVDIDTPAFHDLLRQSRQPITTSAPSPASFLSAFEKASSRGGSVLCITVSARFSASIDSARAAMRELQERRPEVRVEVMDSGSAAGGEGLVALEAWRAARRGCDLSVVTEAANLVADRTRLLASVDTLHYLWKGGRVPAIAHAGTSLLQLKPTFELRRGKVTSLARPRTRRRAIRKLIELMHERVTPGKVHAAVMHGDAAEDAETLKDMIASEFDCASLYVAEFTPVMGAHIGPGLLGVAFFVSPD
jgi:DegV family protein with EDD domain